MANIETARFDRFGKGRARLLVDVGAQFALHHRIEEREDFAFRAADLKFNPAVRQVPNPADDVEPFGNLSNRPAKTDALDIAFVKDLKRDHARSQ
jgi:hypothetical protein